MAGELQRQTAEEHFDWAEIAKGHLGEFAKLDGWAIAKQGLFQATSDATGAVLGFKLGSLGTPPMVRPGDDAFRLDRARSGEDSPKLAGGITLSRYLAKHGYDLGTRGPCAGNYDNYLLHVYKGKSLLEPKVVHNLDGSGAIFLRDISRSDLQRTMGQTPAYLLALSTSDWITSNPRPIPLI